MEKRICTAPGCTNVASCRARYCSKHRQRLSRYGALDAPPAPTPQERFWAKVRKTDTCWLWTASTAGGYGRFREFKRSPSTAAHRYAYEDLVGPIPEGLVLDHLCRVHNCVNPAHLEPVTQGENLRRGVGFPAQQARKTHCIRGHALPPFRPGAERNCTECMRFLNKRAWERRRARRKEAAS